MSEVQKYLDCGCALLVGGERVWCPSCSGAAFDADPPPTVVDAKQSIADLERQLAEVKAEIELFKSKPEGAWFGMWEISDSDRMKLRADIEAMRPVVEAARFHERSVTFYSHGTSSDIYHCDVCKAYKAYEARKPK